MDKAATGAVTAVAGPNLALTKYWGKIDGGVNLPATPSLGVTLAGLAAEVTVSPADGSTHEVYLDGSRQPLARYAAFLEAAARTLDCAGPWRFDCHNDFPTAAGLASSAAGFAAMAVALAAFCGKALSPKELSALARVGSGSASRAVFGGFVQWPRGAEAAEPLFGPDHWPELRILVCLVEAGPKGISSRKAMQWCREHSPFYSTWVADAQHLHRQAVEAVRRRDLGALGPVLRHSAYRMFATMLAAEDPIVYWQPASLSLLRALAALRAEGLSVWETMDAGPQIKCLTLADQLDPVRSRLEASCPGVCFRVATVGAGPWLR